MSREYPDHFGELSTQAMQDALDELEKWVTAVTSLHPELATGTIPKCIRVIRLVEAMPRRSPWLSHSTGASRGGGTLETLMWNAFFFFGEDPSAMKHDPRYKPVSAFGELYLDTWREARREQDEWYRRWKDIGWEYEEEVVEIFVVNKSTLVTDEDAELMTAAVSLQMHRDFALAWGITPPSVAYLAQNAPEPGNTVIIAIMDNADQAGDLGWHTEGPNGIKYGRVFAEPVLQNGGNALTNDLSVASVLSHEVMETTGDPACNRWCDTGNGVLVALEVGDPVESDSYVIPAGGQNVTVSDFVYPAWFDPGAPAGAVKDHMRLTSEPFEVRPTGYNVTMTEGTVSQVFGREYPEWRKATKKTPTARTQRRVDQSEKKHHRIF
jgi:hypothetical protein